MVDRALVGCYLHIEFSHLLIGHGTVGQVHVDVPRRVGHDDRKLAEDLHREGADVAIDELGQVVAREVVALKVAWCEQRREQRCEQRC